MAITWTAGERLVECAAGFVTVPWPVRQGVATPDGMVVLLGAPVGLAAAESLVMVAEDGVRWVAEATAEVPHHDPYVHAWVDGDRLMAESAHGYRVELDAESGAGTLVDESDR